MKTINARIKSHGIRISERYYNSLELWLELELEGSGGVMFSVWGPWSEEYENMFTYSLKKVLDIADVKSVEDLDGAPIRAIFDAPEDDTSMLGRRIIGIQHFLTDEKFIPSEDKMYENVKINGKL